MDCTQCGDSGFLKVDGDATVYCSCEAGRKAAEQSQKSDWIDDSFDKADGVLDYIEDFFGMGDDDDDDF